MAGGRLMMRHFRLASPPGAAAALQVTVTGPKDEQRLLLAADGGEGGEMPSMKRCLLIS